MANRKSSITAQLELKGQAQFKSGLKDIGTAAQRAGKDVQKVRPPDVTLTPTYQYWKARERGEKMMTAMMKAEADKRVKNEREAALRASRITHSGAGRWSHLEGTQFGGRRAGQGAGTGTKGSRMGGDLSTAYYVAQDLAQGGPAAIANQIPQIVDMVARHPSLKTAAAGVIAAGSFGVLGAAINYAYNASESVVDKKGFDRYEQNQLKRQRKFRDEGTGIGEAQSQRQSNYGRYVDQQIGGVESRFGRDENRRRQEMELRDLKLSSITDPAEKAKEAAELEKKYLRESLDANRNKAKEILKIADQEKSAAEDRIRAINAEKVAMGNSFKTDAEIKREAELTAELVGVTNRLAQARERANAASAAVVGTREDEQSLERQKKIIDEKLKLDLEAIQAQKEADIMDEVRAATRDRLTMRQMQRDIAEQDAEKQKRLQKTRDEVSQQESLSGLSPRRRAKAEEEMQKKARVESLKSEGFGGKEAEEIASREAKIASRSQVDADRASRGLRPRIRTITDKGETARNRFNRMSSGDKKKLEGLSSTEDAATTYMRKQRGGLDAYGGDDALSDRPRESNLRKPIRGAGAKREPERDSKTIGGQINEGWQTVVKKLDSVIAAIDRGNKPDGKPISSTSVAA